MIFNDDEFISVNHNKNEKLMSKSYKRDKSKLQTSARKSRQLRNIGMVEEDESEFDSVALDNTKSPSRSKMIQIDELDKSFPDGYISIDLGEAQEDQETFKKMMPNADQANRLPSRQSVSREPSSATRNEDSLSVGRYHLNKSWR